MLPAVLALGLALAPLGYAQTAEVRTEAELVAAIDDGAELIVIKEHISLQSEGLVLASSTGAVVGDCADPPSDAVLADVSSVVALRPLIPRQCLLVHPDPLFILEGSPVLFDNLYLRLESEAKGEFHVGGGSTFYITRSTLQGLVSGGIADGSGYLEDVVIDHGSNATFSGISIGNNIEAPVSMKNVDVVGATTSLPLNRGTGSLQLDNTRFFPAGPEPAPCDEAFCIIEVDDIRAVENRGIIVSFWVDDAVNLYAGGGSVLLPIVSSTTASGIPELDLIGSLDAAADAEPPFPGATDAFLVETQQLLTSLGVGSLAETEEPIVEEEDCGFLDAVPCTEGCNEGLEEVDGVCRDFEDPPICGFLGAVPCPDGCDDGLFVNPDFGVCDDDDGVDPPICGFLYSVPCPQGCYEGLEEVDGVCRGPDDPPICGFLGTVPCADGCNDGLFVNENLGVCDDDDGENPPTCGALGTEPCDDGCYDGLYEEAGLCMESDDDECGADAQAPCEDTGCDGELIVVEGFCEACGSRGEPVCPDTGCNAPFIPKHMRGDVRLCGKVE